MKVETAGERRKVGRPLSFDRATALRQAMLLFWRHGYEATSVSQLTAAMKITAPSLYAAFGDKKCLFLEAIELYVSGGPITALGLIASAGSAREAVETLWKGAAVGLTGADTPAGCMLVGSAMNGSPASADVQAALAAIRRGIEGALRSKIERDVELGVLPIDLDPEALASFSMAVIQGMSSQARDGAGRSKMLKMAEIALRAWPIIENRGEGRAVVT